MKPPIRIRAAVRGPGKLAGMPKPVLAGALLLAVSFGVPSSSAGTQGGQQASDAARSGPYDRLVIRNAMVIPGHGGPAYGPADIVIEGDIIARIISYNGVTGRPEDAALPPADRVIDATGMYVMPGLIDLHTHHHAKQSPQRH
jgi:adenine deaminase